MQTTRSSPVTLAALTSWAMRCGPLQGIGYEFAVRRRGSWKRYTQEASDQDLEHLLWHLHPQLALSMAISRVHSGATLDPTFNIEI